MSAEQERDTLDALAERIDQAMRRHAQGHHNSNSPSSFYCSPECVSEHLRIVVEREAAAWKPPLKLASS